MNSTPIFSSIASIILVEQDTPPAIILGNRHADIASRTWQRYLGIKIWESAGVPDYCNERWYTSTTLVVTHARTRSFSLIS